MVLTGYSQLLHRLFWAVIGTIHSMLKGNASGVCNFPRQSGLSGVSRAESLGGFL